MIKRTQINTHTHFRIAVAFVYLLFVSPWIYAQQADAKVITLDDAVNLALSNHPISKNAALGVDAAKALKNERFNLKPTDITWDHGQIYSPLSDNRISVSQDLGSPVTHIQRYRLYKNEVGLSESSQKLTQKELIASVKEAYYKWVYQIVLIAQMENEAALYEEFFGIVKLHSDSGITNILEKTIAETKYAEAQRKLLTSQEQLKIVVNNINRYLYSEEKYQPAQKDLELYTIRFPEGQADKFYPYTFKEYFQQQVNRKSIELSLEKSYLYPGITAGYFNQSIGSEKNLQGFQLGISVPLWFLPQTSRIKEARINKNIKENEIAFKTYELEQTIDDLKIKLDQEFINVVFFRENALPQSDLLIQNATLKLQKDEIPYTEYLQSIAEALKIKHEYLNSVLNYNLTAIELEYMLN